MVCEHLAQVEAALLAGGHGVDFRGAAWSRDCREWVYFNCYLDTRRIREAFVLADCVADHSHRGTHDGQEHGLECTLCHDALMGAYEAGPSMRVFPP